MRSTTSHCCMGIIQRQGLKKSLVQYTGVLIGAFSTFFIFPLAVPQYGLLRFLIATATLILPLVNLGTNTAILRFFPEFRHEKKGHHGFLALLLMVIAAGFVLVVLLAQLTRPAIIAYYSDRDPLLQENLFYVLPLSLLIALTYMLTIYISNFLRVVVPTILHELTLKIALPVFILLYVYGLLDEQGLIYGLLITYTLIVLALLGYLRRLDPASFSKPRFDFLNAARLRRIADYSLFGFLGSVGSLLAFQIDTFMVGSLSGLYATGVYSIALFIAGTIDIPMRSLQSITAPIVSDAWQKKDLPAIAVLYKKTSLILLAAGCALLSLIWINLDELAEILPKGEVFRQGKYVILLLGLAKISDLATSINNPIINFSKYYRFNLYAVFFLGISNVLLNLWLIPKYQIVGAALASAISLAAFNALKAGFIYLRFGMQPFTRASLRVLLFTAGGLIAVYLLPGPEQPVIAMLLQSFLFVLIFGLGNRHLLSLLINNER